ncbi:MAG: hypothetical protein UX18_C0019G0002 [Candidatus Azambacteria bacterium GW2011_GWC2_45_7b]|uniref:Uncharacterized protein n=1 Tax=Candidatus Azambacteria bacterium GW2011_GWC2_45_7b TaxID=1618621 RepID=A0A837IGY5_9BACT|nr:MAG: hypothetical protein UX18_C0019G0002 [Candidatus Azambacteria bacterium GW2011_GWC2_45_7b]
MLLFVLSFSVSRCLRVGLILLCRYPFRNYLSQIPDLQLPFRAAGFDAVLEHGETEGAVGYQQGRAGVGGHLDSGFTDFAAQFLFGDYAAAPGAAAEAVVAVFVHFGD